MSSNAEPAKPRESSILFCFCAPAGTGKSTVCEKLLAADSSLLRSISTTTRQPRDGERNGLHYWFVAEEEFNKRVLDGRFIEHAAFGGNYYGTEKTNIELAAEQNRDLVLTIDVEGVKNLKSLYPEQVVTVFMFPPSFSDLAERLRRRGSEDLDSQAARLAIAEREIEILRAPGFSDYLLINDKLEQAVHDAQAIIETERRRLTRFRPEYLTALLEKR